MLNSTWKVAFKGPFNARIPPALHKAAVLRAVSDNSSLNDVLMRALDAFVNAVSGLSLPQAIRDGPVHAAASAKPKVKRTIERKT